MNIITDFIKILELKRYSKNTIESYQSHLRLVRSHFDNKSFKQISDKELFEFIYHLIHTKNISASYQRQIVGGLKLFYKEIYNRQIPFENLKVERQEKKLPVVLSKQEVRALCKFS